MVASQLPPLLQAAGFEFDGERAEWLRWFNEIQAFKGRYGHCEPHPLAHPNGALGYVGGAACCLHSLVCVRRALGSLQTGAMAALAASEPLPSPACHILRPSCPAPPLQTSFSLTG